MDDRETYITLLAEEYRTLAAGGNQADKHTYTALQWGTAVVGLIVGAAISQWGKHDAVVELSFLFGVPALVAMGMLFWVGELARMSRISDFICVLETKIELALQIPDSESDAGRWLERFQAEWTAERKALLAKAQLSMPMNRHGEVVVETGPITFEHWLRAIRNTSASSNLIWVFIVRIALFPAAMSASWTIGVYYVLFQSTARGFSWESLVVALIGLTVGVTAVWLAAELVTDLSRSSSNPVPISEPRARFRKLVSRPLRITEWQKERPAAL